MNKKTRLTEGSTTFCAQIEKYFKWTKYHKWHRYAITLHYENLDHFLPFFGFCYMQHCQLKLVTNQTNAANEIHLRLRRRLCRSASLAIRCCRHHLNMFVVFVSVFVPGYKVTEKCYLVSWNNKHQCVTITENQSWLVILLIFVSFK